MPGERTFFITAVCWGRRPLFHNERAARLLLDVLFHYREQKKFLLHEFVVMPDHLHALLTPADNISLERAVQLIKGGFSYRLASRLPVWQASFTNHRVRDAEDYVRLRGYIHRNPERGRLQDDYPYTSAQPGFALDCPPPGLKPRLQQSA